jgi:EmrB/QacA subfamily drug resistance transporter
MARAGSGVGQFLHRPLCPEGRGALDAICEKPCAERARPYVLAATILASAMAFIDGSVVTIALPALQSDFGATFGALQWVVNAYALLLGGLILIGGAAGDRFGRNRIFVLGIALFALASLACALAPTVWVLILARGIQGIGAALLVPQSLAIIAASFPKDVRRSAIGTWAAASAITTAMGPPLGGFLIDAFDWRGIFWINLPLSVATIWLTMRYIPESRTKRTSRSLDWRGAVLAIFAFGALTIGLTLVPDFQGANLAVVLPLGLGVVGLAAFIRAEARAEDPLMPLSLFRVRAFAAANLVTLFLYGALAGVLFLLPFDLIAHRGLSATEVGLTLLPIGIIIGIFSRVAGAAADRHGPRSLMVAGSVLVTLSAVGLAIELGDFWLGVIVPVVLLAAGLALVVAPLTTAVMNAVADDHAGAASGVNNAATRLAGLFAVAILGSVTSLTYLGELSAVGFSLEALRFGILPPVGDPGRAVLEAAFLAAYAAALWTAALWGGLATLTAAVFLRPVRSSSG